MNRTLMVLLFAFISGACALVISVTACTDEESSLKALQAQGFTHIEFTGYKLLPLKEHPSPPHSKP